MPRVVHFELSVDDPERAITFYSTVFGWQINKWESTEDYWLVTTGAAGTLGVDGGIMRRGTHDAPVVNTLDVPSVDEYVAKITTNGGTLVAPKMAIPGVGYLAYCKDTEGTTFGIMQADPTAT